MTSPVHVSVLLQEIIDGLDIHPGDIIIDGTVGSGGHSLEIIKRFGDTVRIIALDADEDALERSQTKLNASKANIEFVHENFRNLDHVLDTLKVTNVQRILLDIGLSSDQLHESGRGFSFQTDEPLRMTFKKSVTEEDVTAEIIVNKWSEETLRTIIHGYGEERYANRIARAIVVAREQEAITTTGQLASIIAEATPKSYGFRKINPATKTFQALRIAVNDELQALKEGIEKGFEKLSPDGRMAVISFHSLEDRIVKQFFRAQADAEKAILITRKPITATEEEILQNPRARSAKLRVILKQ